MFRLFLEMLAPSPAASILDVGVSSDTVYQGTNYFEAWWPRKEGIVALGFEDAAFLERIYPGLRFLRGDARSLPFRDGAFDYVHSSAVIEHAGSEGDQTRLISESLRVASRAVFLTTPNRWFPVELHTTLPLLHWLPKAWHRRLLRRLGRADHAEEANLNLLGAADVRKLSLAAGARSIRILGVRTWGWPSNLVAIVEK